MAVAALTFDRLILREMDAVLQEYHRMACLAYHIFVRLIELEARLGIVVKNEKGPFYGTLMAFFAARLPVRIS